MADKDKPDASGSEFAALIGKVRRLNHDTVEFEPRRPPARRRAPMPEQTPAIDTYGAYEADHDEDEYHRNGVQTSVLRKLRRGQYPIENELDLHGLTVPQAHALLLRFLAHAGGSRLQCVRIIHGKGLSSPGFKAVLKPRVRHWLRQDPRVLAFVPAPPHDGGHGAMYVLLRSR